jgi:magnesium chelatase family protein
MLNKFVTFLLTHNRITFPSKSILIAAQSPSPCGYLGDNTSECKHSSSQVSHYQKQASGPTLNRIDIRHHVPEVKVEKLTGQSKTDTETSRDIRKRVQKVRDIQLKKFKDKIISSNAEIYINTIKASCSLSENYISLSKQAVKINLLARSWHRIIKLAVTIADLKQENNIKSLYIAENLQYQPRTLEHR